MQCPHCHNEHPDGIRFCPVTGQPIELLPADPAPEPVLTCPNCGRAVQSHWQHCPSCSARLDAEATAPVPVSVRKRLRPKRALPPLAIIALIAACAALSAGAAGIYWLVQNWDRAAQIIQPAGETPEDEQAAEVGGIDTEAPQPSDSPRITETFPSAFETSTVEVATPFPTVTLPPPDTPTPVLIPSLTPGRTSTSTPMVGGLTDPCPGTYYSRLKVGDRAAVTTTPNLPNRVRELPSLSAKILGKIEPGEQIKVIDGPACGDIGVWWKVRSERTGLTGWTLEGDRQDYWLVPIN